MPTPHPLYQQAIDWFKKLYGKVLKSGIDEPTAVALATAGPGGGPSIRMVLLKGVDQRGFTFYTNTLSRKGKQLADTPKAALCFYWEIIHRQVTVEGVVERVSDEEADVYWGTRSRNSQVGGWASLQSQRLSGWKELLMRIVKFEVEFAGKRVPRPPHWTGFRIIPKRIEFWKRGPFRIHKRIVYAEDGLTWTKNRLYP